MMRRGEKRKGGVEEQLTNKGLSEHIECQYLELQPTSSAQVSPFRYFNPFPLLYASTIILFDFLGPLRSSLCSSLSFLCFFSETLFSDFLGGEDSSGGEGDGGRR